MKCTATMQFLLGSVLVIGPLLADVDTGSLKISGNPSDVGFVTPPYGVTNNLTLGDTFQVLVQTAATNSAFIAFYQGYELWNLNTVSGERQDLAAQGTATTINYEHGSSARELILYWTNLTSQATAIVSGNGTVTATPATFPYGTVTQVVFTATPEPGHARYLCRRG